MLNTILERIDSRHLASLWAFYRDYFSSDNECLQFIYNTLRQEPPNTNEIYGLDSADEADFDESLFFPRQMLSSVERLVSAARDMERIRAGKDVFKIVFLITCVETLQGLANPTMTGNKFKEWLLPFFEENTSTSDKEFIASHFFHDDEDSAIDGSENSFEQFVAVLNEYRNCAAHEGDYWDYCFNSSSDDCPTLLPLRIDLKEYSRKNKREHCFQTCVSYEKFESIFVRTCITFIQNYVKRTFPTTEVT